MSTAFKFPAEGFNINGGTIATSITSDTIGGGGGGSVVNTAFTSVAEGEVVSISGASGVIGVYEEGSSTTSSPRYTIPNTDYVDAYTANTNNDAKWASNRACIVTGSSLANAYLAYDRNYEVKYVISHITAFIPDKITFENYHNSGTNTNLGVKNVLVYGSNAATRPVTTYSDDTDLTLLATIEVSQHSGNDVAAPEEFSISTSTAYKHYVLKLVDNHGGSTYIGFRKVYLSGQYAESYPAIFDTTTARATNALVAGHPYTAIDPTKLLTGDYSNYNGWVTDSGYTTNLKFNVNFATAIIAKGLYLENNHHSGAITNTGVQSCILYGSNDANDYLDTTYANVSGTMTELTSFTATEHISQNSSHPQYVFFTNTTAYRYYILRITNNLGGARTGFRRFTMLVDNQEAGSCVMLSNTTDYTVSKATVSSTDLTITRNKIGASNLSVSYIPSV